MFRVRYLILIGLIAASLVTLVVVTATSLIHQQNTYTVSLQRNLKTRQAASDFDRCLDDLVLLENDNVEKVAVLHKRAGDLLRTLKSAMGEDSRERYDGIAHAFATYLSRWDSLPPIDHPNHEATRREVTTYLDDEVHRPTVAFEEEVSSAINAAVEHHESTLAQLAWGITVVGALGTLAGAVLGAGLAREYSRSIRKLRIQIKDASGRLSPNMPELVVTGDSDLDSLHAEADRLKEKVEDTIRSLRARELEVARAEQLAGVGQLAAGVGHEIRNPLTSIKLLIQAGLEDEGGLTTEELRLIEGETRRIEQTLTRFLNIARPPKMEKRITDLVALVEEVVGLMKGRAEKQRVSITVNRDADKIALQADAEQLRQVLVNVCLNALDAMPGGGALELGVRATVDRAEVIVNDTGSGIAPAILPRLFEPFVSGKETGLGLGLVISKRIVETHGGAISVANRSSGGASIHVSLPRSLAKPATEASHADHTRR